MNVSENDRKLLLEYQRARYAFDAFPEVEKARGVYEQAKENLKQIKEPTIAELVRRLSQEWTKDVTPDSCSLNVARAEDIIFAEKDLYEMTWQYGDNTRNETDMIQ